MDGRSARRLALALGILVAASVALAARVDAGKRQAAGSKETAPPVRAQPHKAAHARRARPPQFVAVSFDGAGGTQLWPYWRSVAARAHAHFTYFVSGVYLLADEKRNLYRPPRHGRGVSDIWFARPDGGRSAQAVVRGTLAQIAAGYEEGHEIGTHYNGHFCEPYRGNVDE